MTNRINKIDLYDLRLDPAEAEVGLSIEPEHLTSTTQVIARLVGPRCPYSTTIEVAYPFRECARTYASEVLFGIPKLDLRAIIPEPSLWDPQTPFLYQAVAELWQDGQRFDQIRIRHGLRVLNLGPRGVRCNARLLPIRGAALKQCSEEEARCLHEVGYNALLAPVTAHSSSLWDIADRFGFMMLGHLTEWDDRADIWSLDKHPCCLGWVLGSELLAHPLTYEVVQTLHTACGELLQEAHAQLPGWLDFAVCAEQLLPALGEVHLPKIVLREAKAGANSQPAWAASPGILGWIDLSS
jgi:hypothetical protein